MSQSDDSFTFMIEERSGIPRVNEPVTVGMPFPKGWVHNISTLALFNEEERRIPLQCQVLTQWSDKSIKWALLDFSANANPKQATCYVVRRDDTPFPEGEEAGFVVRQEADAVVVDTGCGVFYVNTKIFHPFNRVVVGGVDILEVKGCSTVLRDAQDREYEPVIQETTVEANGPVRFTLKIDGVFYAVDRDAASVPFAEFVARLSLYAKTNLVELKFTIRNPNAAEHPGGLWDLGDTGSVYFKDLSMMTSLSSRDDMTTEWIPDLGQPWETLQGSQLEIYQDSSGGQNWNSSNHVNRDGVCMNSFQGYRVAVDGVKIREGKRATPCLSIRNQQNGLSGTIAQFWQNFPKAMEVENRGIRMRMFPHQYRDVHELQGGEQKTHTVYWQFHAADDTIRAITACHDRLLPRATPEWYTKTGAFAYVIPRTPQDTSSSALVQAEALVDGAVQGNMTFFDRREIIDEYGWRNYGDLYGDHEAVGHQGHTPLVSHYNNQYDVVYGAILHYVRTGDVRWFRLADDLAKHVIDIDIYHTKNDRLVYNGGLFWHSEHYTDAGTATHRSFSKANVGTTSAYQHGGGHSNEHNYTTGLLHYYYLTGDVSASETVQGLADWVVNMDDGSERWLGWLDKRPTGLCSQTSSRDYHGPGRGCGNSINALLDAFMLTGKRDYYRKADELIQRSIHPKDDIDGRTLEDVEMRWSYLVFLQVLGKFLDMKVGLGEIDDMYSYARNSLLVYAAWMSEHEVPYMQVMHKVTIPTETWPAQDIRKSNVFLLAAKYADEPSMRMEFLKKADHFFNRCITDLLTFKTCTLTRPTVLIMTNVHMYPYFRATPIDDVPVSRDQYDVHEPRPFAPQLYEIIKAREVVFHMLTAVKDAKAQLSTLWRGDATSG